MNTPLPLSLLELLILIAGAIMLGITIHFFIVSRRTLNAGSPQTQLKISRELEERKLRYLNDIEWRDREMLEMKEKMDALSEQNEILSIEAEELREKNRKLNVMNQELGAAAKTAPPKKEEHQSGLALQLKEAQAEMLAYNRKISELIHKMETTELLEEKKQSLETENASLKEQVDDLLLKLEEAEQQLHSSRQKKEISSEMSSMLDNAFSEFSLLQEKIARMESQVAGTQRLNLELIDAQEEIAKLSKMLEENKQRYAALQSQKAQLEDDARETEEKLREANFQRQQMQKRISYLEELNLDLQSVAEVNKNLQSQIKRIGELESMLQLLSEEKAEMMRRRNG